MTIAFTMLRIVVLVSNILGTLVSLIYLLIWYRFISLLCWMVFIIRTESICILLELHALLRLSYRLVYIYLVIINLNAFQKLNTFSLAHIICKYLLYLKNYLLLVKAILWSFNILVSIVIATQECLLQFI